MFGRPRPLVAALALVISLGLGSAWASSSYELSRTELSWVADVVVRGEIVTTQARWKADRTGIYTWTELRITESLKGPHAAGDTVLIRALGGQDGSQGAQVVGEARYSVGEEVVVFLETARDGHLRTVGMAQGRFTLVPDVDGGPAVVVRPLLPEDEAYDHTLLQVPAWERPETAQEFLRAVRSDILLDRLPSAVEIPGLPEAKQVRLREAHATVPGGR